MICTSSSCFSWSSMLYFVIYDHRDWRDLVHYSVFVVSLSRSKTHYSVFVVSLSRSKTRMNFWLIWQTHWLEEVSMSKQNHKRMSSFTLLVVFRKFRVDMSFEHILSFLKIFMSAFSFAYMSFLNFVKIFFRLQLILSSHCVLIRSSCESNKNRTIFKSSKSRVHKFWMNCKQSR